MKDKNNKDKNMNVFRKSFLLFCFFVCFVTIANAKAEKIVEEDNSEITVKAGDTSSSTLTAAIIIGISFIIGMAIYVNCGNKKDNEDNKTKTSTSQAHEKVPYLKNGIASKLSTGNTLANRYTIKRNLGQGGFGVTYLAEQNSLQRKVAIKEFFMKDLSERNADGSIICGTANSRAIVERCRQKFIKEARLIASFDNPHIVKVHDVFDENGTAYYVMDYVEGKTLKEIVDRTPLPEAQAVNYIKQIGDALSYIHNRNVLHLDVKPSNILIKSDGTAVLIDFGISKRYDSVGEQTTTTPTGVSKGYAPIEQYSQDLTTFTPATDVYALGATLYFAITGIVPPEATIISEDCLSDGRNKMSECTYTAIVKAMQQSRSNRPQSIDAFLQLLTDSDTSKNIQNDDTLICG